MFCPKNMPLNPVNDFIAKAAFPVYTRLVSYKDKDMTQYCRQSILYTLGSLQRLAIIFRTIHSIEICIPDGFEPFFLGGGFVYDKPLYRRKIYFLVFTRSGDFIQRWQNMLVFHFLHPIMWAFQFMPGYSL